MYRFDELLKVENRESLIGMKAESLIRLRGLGFNVPDGFVITTDELESLTALELSEFVDEKSAYAVRSSSTGEDLADSSFAGQYDTYLNVKGLSAVFEAVRKCADSIHKEGLKAYAAYSGIDIADCKMAVIVQYMVPSEKAGVAFSINAITGDDREIIVEAVRGSG